MAWTGFLDGKVTLHAGDCLEVLATLADASVDSIVCDPPYGLEFMGKAWDSFSGAGMTKPGIGERDTEWPSFLGTNKTRCRSCGHLVGQGGSACRCVTPEPYNAALPRSHGFGEWCQLWAAECLRILKPGGHLVAFGGTRTYHRLACAIEDAGFEIRDQIGWCYGSGFPKSHNVSKGIDKAAGAQREVIGPSKRHAGKTKASNPIGDLARYSDAGDVLTAPATDAAKQWEGWGTALKPAWEPIVLARKPLIGTVADNVLKHGVGGLNVDACRVEPTGERLGGGGEKAETAGQFTNDGWRRPWMDDPEHSEAFASKVRANVDKASELGRFPANVIHDGSDEVMAAFPDALGQQAEISATAPSPKTSGIYGKMNREGEASASRRYTDEGATNFAVLPGMRRETASSAARFFYTAKADAEDRLGSKHPTVKPLDLMQWLVRLVTPKGGTVLDPFAGTGTTGEAAWREGMRAILIEREAEYQEDIVRRMDLATKPTKRAAVAASKGKLEKPEDLPLFATAAGKSSMGA